MNNNRKVIFLDMDGVLADYQGAVKKLPIEMYEKYKGKHDEIPNFFITFDPIEGSLHAVDVLKKHFDLFILSTGSWNNNTSLSDKIEWIKQKFGYGAESPFYKRVILSHRKDVMIGDYLIDDRTVNGAKDFKGEFIHFGSEGLETWDKVLLYIINKENIDIDTLK